MAEIATLRRKRGSIKKSITHLTKALDDWIRQDAAERDPDCLQAHLEGVQQSFSGFSEIQEEIEEIDENETAQRSEIEMKFYAAVGRTKRLLREHHGASSAASSRASTPISSSAPISVALPKIELPKFDGAPEEWAAFYDLFSSLIDRNETLHAVQKLQYLRLSLKERAASAIQSLETTERNYAIALETLKKKFECERKILRRHWEMMCEYPRLQKDTPTALTNLVDTIYQHTLALKNLKAPTDQWDIPLISLILSRVSQNTAWQWELTLTDNKMPAYTKLLEFLEKRANCSDFASQSGASDNNKNGNSRQDEKTNRRGKPSYEPSRAQTFATTDTPTCSICKQGHRIYTCDRFRALSVDEKWKAVSDASLCHNCLGKGHSNKTCKAERTCRVCQKRHHTYLHKPAGTQQTAVQPTPSTSQTPSEGLTISKA